MSSKSHTHKRFGIWRKKSVSTRGYAEIHIQRLFFDNKKDIKNSWIEDPNGENML
jgi:hypothetical protein